MTTYFLNALKVNFDKSMKFLPKEESLLATCTCRNIAKAHLFFKFDEFYISKGVLPIPYRISYTAVCSVSQFYPYTLLKRFK